MFDTDILLYALEVIKWEMEEMGMKTKDKEPIIRSKGHFSAVFYGKGEKTLKLP